MELKISRVYVFQNGTRIDLEKVVCIGAIDKDEYYNICIPVFFTGTNKSVKIVLGNSIGHVSDESKQRINTVYNDFVSEWEQYILQKDQEKIPE